MVEILEKEEKKQGIISPKVPFEKVPEVLSLNLSKKDFPIKTFYTKVVKHFNDFSTAATTLDITLFTLPVGGEILTCFMNGNVAFTGGSISAYTISVGPAGAETTLLTAQSVFTTGLNLAVGTDFTTNRPIFSLTARTTIEARATSTGANLDAATAGRATFYFLYVIHK